MSEEGAYTRGTLYWQLVSHVTIMIYDYLCCLSERYMASSDMGINRIFREMEASSLCNEKGTC
jgi:hypothetical protein